MDEQQAWIRSRRKKRLRLLAAALAFCLLFTTFPEIAESLSVFAEGSQGDDVRYVSRFERLPKEVREQTVPVGTEIEELMLPDTLEAAIVISKDEAAPEDAGEGKEDRPEEGETPSEGTEEEQENPSEGTEEEQENPSEDTGEEQEDPSESTGEESENPEDPSDADNGEDREDEPEEPEIGGGGATVRKKAPLRMIRTNRTHSRKSLLQKRL